MSVCSGRRTKGLASSSSPQRTNLLRVVSAVLWRQRCPASPPAVYQSCCQRERGCGFLGISLSVVWWRYLHSPLCRYSRLSLTLFHSPTQDSLGSLASCLCSFSPNCEVSGSRGTVYHVLPAHGQECVRLSRGSLQDVDSCQAVVW